MMYAVRNLLWALAPVVVLCIIVAASKAFIPATVHGDYTHTITVDKSEKIETAVSNVLDCLARRDFVPVNLRVTRSFDGTYTVRGSGTDRGNLIRRD